MNLAVSICIALGILYAAYRLLCTLLSSFLRKHYTALSELEDLGKPRSDGRKIGGTVLIAGGSLAGLWTARVCADHFERVLVIDSDEGIVNEGDVLDERPDVKYVGEDGMRAPGNPRTHVFQYRSLHVTQTFALMAMQKCFAGWDELLKSAGGLMRPQQFHWYYSGLPLAPFEHLLPEESKTLHWCSRALIERLIRRCVKNTCENVEFVVGTVTGINSEPENWSKIASVAYKRKDDDAIHNEPAVLFVDCAGPTHNGLKWLSQAGYGNMTNGQVSVNQLPLSNLLETYHPKLAYSTSVWPVDAKQSAELENIIPDGYENQAWYYSYVAMPTKSSTICIIGRQENNQVVVLCGGRGKLELPRTPKAIIEFVRGVSGHRPVPDWIFDFLDVLFIRKNEGTFENIRAPPCSRVMYSKALNMPINFIAVGDAYVRANPVYGQGHSKCVMGATVLDSLLRTVSSDSKGIPSKLASQFFKQQERQVSSPIWDFTKLQDYAFNVTRPVRGESLTDGAFMRWYTTNFLLAATWDSEIAKTFDETQMFTAPSLTVFKPSIVAKVLWEACAHRAGRS